MAEGFDQVGQVLDPLLACVVLLVLLYFGSLVNIIINNNLFLNSLRTLSTFEKVEQNQWSKTSGAKHLQQKREQNSLII
jgi:hypothetical protein